MRVRGVRAACVLGAVASAACSIFSSYDGIADLPAPGARADGGGEAGERPLPGDGSAGVDGGVDGSGPSVCDPEGSPATNPCALGDGLGVFVSPRGNDANAGTSSSPVATLQHAAELARSSSKRIYACAGTYPQALVLDAADGALKVFGGLACSAADAGPDAPPSWRYTGQRAIVAPAEPGIALSLAGLTQAVTFEDVDFLARAATGVEPDGAGRSSIAVLVASSWQGVTFRRSTITASAGARGNGGVADANYLGGQASGGNTPPSATLGAPQQACACRISGSSVGGKGGDAAPVTAGADGSALPAPVAGAAPRDGRGGRVGTFGAKYCENGNSGTHGAATSAPATGAAIHGVLTAAGWAPQAGGDGVFGGPGQGGGGASGGQLAALLSPGGGGGCGGCGGSGGTGGKGGGASIAIVAFATPVRLEASALVTGSAGIGGNGGAGQAGQTGGDRGAPRDGQPSELSCSGGFGGHGAGGSGGGGGAGGVSIGLAYVGAAPLVDGVAVTDAPTFARVTLGGFGTGGPAGPSGGAGGGGADGASNAGPAGTAGRDGIAYAVKPFP